MESNSEGRHEGYEHRRQRMTRSEEVEGSNTW